VSRVWAKHPPGANVLCAVDLHIRALDHRHRKRNLAFDVSCMCLRQIPSHDQSSTDVAEKRQLFLLSGLQMPYFNCSLSHRSGSSTGECLVPSKDRANFVPEHPFSTFHLKATENAAFTNYFSKEKQKGAVVA